MKNTVLSKNKNDENKKCIQLVKTKNNLVTRKDILNKELILVLN